MNIRNRSLEIETIAPRTITLQLSTVDVQRLSEKAISAGFTIAQLLENFVGDLVDGTHTNGSDERYYAGYWYDRCGFEYTARKSFLRYLSNCSDPAVVTDTWEDYLTEKGVFEDDSEDITAEERNSAKAAMNECLEEIKKEYATFCSWAGAEAIGLEQEMAELLGWKRDTDKLKWPERQYGDLTPRELNELHHAFNESTPYKTQKAMADEMSERLALLSDTWASYLAEKGVHEENAQKCLAEVKEWFDAHRSWVGSEPPTMGHALVNLLLCWEKDVIDKLIENPEQEALSLWEFDELHRARETTQSFDAMQESETNRLVAEPETDLEL